MLYHATRTAVSQCNFFNMYNANSHLSPLILHMHIQYLVHPTHARYPHLRYDKRNDRLGQVQEYDDNTG